MEMLQLYVVYDEYLKPVDSNIGSFNRYNHKIDRINIEINEALPEHIFSLNVKRPDGTVNLMGYEVVQVDGTNYYFDVPAWVTEEDGLVEFSLVASTLSQVISFGKFYVDCIDTLQATAQATPDDPTFLSKVDKDLSTYEEVTAIANAFMFVDNDGEPEKIGIVSGDIETDVVLWTGGKIKSELDSKQDVITDNSIGNDLLAQMPTMTIKGNDTGATANAKDLTVVEVMELLSPSGTMEVPHNLKVYGNIEQVGGSYETHQEQVYTTKDHIILRDGAVGGLGTGSYAGLFAKLADGTNNSGLVFDGNGMARVGDIGTNLASPDFSQTQALATRQDTPAANAIFYWNSTLSRADNISTIYVDSASGKIVANYIEALTRVIANELVNRGTVNNALVNTSNNGTVISRNIADANPALKVQNSHTDSTGNIQEWYANVGGVTAIKGRITKDGGLYLASYLFGNGIANGTSASNSLILTSTNGAVIQRNINDANPALTINEQQGTGNIVNFQFGGVNKVLITKDGYIGIGTTPVQPLHLFSGAGSSDARMRIQAGRAWDIIAGNNTNNNFAPINGFTIRDAAAGFNRLNIDADGKVGIGTIAPTGTLTVVNGAVGDIPATINAITGTTAKLLSLQVAGVEKANITASGRGTFTSLSTGSNTLLGTAGLNITTGTSNVLIGYLTATFLTEGIENVAIGSRALNNAYTNNYSVAIGNRALERLLAGDNTIGIGHNAGRYYGYNYPVNGGDLTTSSNSIYIGNEASAKENSISNEIVIGYNALGNGSNTATIGNSSLTKLYAGSYEVDRVIKSSSISVSSWSADATYAGYGYRATITMTGATSSDSAEVVFAHAEAISGNYSPICETLTDGVYIYSKVNTSITVAQVIVHKA